MQIACPLCLWLVPTSSRLQNNIVCSNTEEGPEIEFSNERQPLHCPCFKRKGKMFSRGAA